VTEQTNTDIEWRPEILVKRYRGGHLIEHRYFDDAEAVADTIEAWEAHLEPEGEIIDVEPHPPRAIIDLLRAIADALELERPLAMSQPFPHLRLQLVAEATEPTKPKRGELTLLWQELAHPGA